MKIGKGVEWAAHTCALLALLPANGALAMDTLSEFIGVPAPYLAKQMQALSRAGLVSTKRGVSGGYRLARLPDTISLWEITAAIEGADPSFRCTEVRRNGPCAAASSECTSPCAIAASFRRAENNFRETLKAVMLTQIVEDISQDMSDERKRRIASWLESNATVMNKGVKK